MFNQFKKYKEIILVDTENVGYKFPTTIPKNYLVYFFISNPNVQNKLKHLTNTNNYKIVNINHAKIDGIPIKDNAMDFCIVTYITYFLSKISKNTKLVILSADKDYDISIYFAKHLFKKREIIRKEYNLETYINQHDNTIQESNHNTSLVLFVFEKQLNNFLNYKRTLSPSIKKKLKYKTCTTQSGKSLLIEKDPLHHCYYLVYSGRYIHMADSIEIMLPLYEQYKKV